MLGRVKRRRQKENKKEEEEEEEEKKKRQCSTWEAAVTKAPATRVHTSHTNQG